MANNRDENAIFENEVRRVARELWPDAQHGGARLEEGLERDGVFETEDCIHLIEATVSRQKAKAASDISKLISLSKKRRISCPQKAIKCWFITREEPTADQRELIMPHGGLVNALSFSQFQSKLIDVASYLSLRENYPFGSVRDPSTGTAKGAIEYVPLDLVQSGSSKVWSIHAIRDALLAGNSFVMLGDYGAGKSMTLREIHKVLKRDYFANRTPRFPIYINLRDHFGQSNASELLERHGRNLGFPLPSHLVRAWRAGYGILLIDGFDELTTVGIQGLWKRLQDSRYRAMQAVREFVREQSSCAGIVLAGRAHYFDSDKERRTALGTTSGFCELALNEFNDEQIQRYLSRSHLSGWVPNWMPSRPLLVGYLATSGVLKDLATSGGGTYTGIEPATGWDLILDRVCAREAEIEAGIDGATVRRILERLATKARQAKGGLGPLSPEQTVSAFSEVCGYQPDEKGMVLLQRLPGLGIDRADEGTRTFIDEQLADACRAGDVVAFVDSPYAADIQHFRGAESGLGQLGTDLAVVRLRKSKITSGKLNSVTRLAVENDDLAVLAFDLAGIAWAAGYPIGVPIQINGILIPRLELFEGMGDSSSLQFRDCFFSTLDLDPNVNSDYLPRFDACYFGEVEGRASVADLPRGVFDFECRFERFSLSADNTSAIGEMPLPLGLIVLLTVLRKIYKQSGSGRKENALHRGLDHHGRRLVAPVLKLLQSEKLIWSYRRAGIDSYIWIPDRTQMPRVAKMLTAPNTCEDLLIEEASNLS